MTTKASRWICATAVAVLAAAAPVHAEDATDPVKHDAASNSAVQGAGSGSGGGSPNTVVDPGKGVAGTGMGTVPAGGNKAGTGQSVKGPAGQGISNSTDTTP